MHPLRGPSRHRSRSCSSPHMVAEHVEQTLLSNCGKTSLSTAQPQCGKMRSLLQCLIKDWEFGGGGWGGNPSCCCQNSKSGDYIPKCKAKCTISFPNSYRFHGHAFCLLGAVQKPLKRTVTPDYKLDRKRLCMHSLTNHLSQAENFIFQENYENKNRVQKYKYLYSLQALHLQQRDSEEHLHVIE